MADPKPTGQITMGFDATPSPDQKDWKKLRMEFEVEAERALEKFRAEIEKTWKEKAQASMSQESSQKYLAGLNFVKESDGVTVEVTGWLPVALEEGQDPFDMKPGLLKGLERRIIKMKNGNFRSVSRKSPSDSWWHPGIEAKKIGEQVKKEEKKIRQKAFGPLFKEFEKKLV